MGGGGSENSNSKTLILKDSSVKSIWTYLQPVLDILQTQINTREREGERERGEREREREKKKEKKNKSA